jgi:hypothetical protein
MGQSNMAAGATIGSNHNSRSPDGELVAGRGFWPGLCVSLKHNSRFASFVLLAKGDYPAELNIPIPFALVSNDISKDELMVMPAYWFLHNMYALARNSWKYVDRDKRIEKTQLLEFDYLAPDTVGEMVDALAIFEQCTGQAIARQSGKTTKYTAQQLREMGAALLQHSPGEADALEILADSMENSDRKVRLVKVAQAWSLFRELIAHHAANQLLRCIGEKHIGSFAALVESIPSNLPMQPWVNAGGQLIRESELSKLIGQIHKGKIKTWPQVHGWYTRQGEQYPADKLIHALAALKTVTGFSLRRDGPQALGHLLRQSVALKEQLTREIYESRSKDYSNPFRKMVYVSPGEMNAVMGRLSDNSFIKQEKEATKIYRAAVEKLVARWKLE